MSNLKKAGAPTEKSPLLFSPSNSNTSSSYSQNQFNSSSHQIDQEEPAFLNRQLKKTFGRALYSLICVFAAGLTIVGVVLLSPGLRLGTRQVLKSSNLQATPETGDDPASSEYLVTTTPLGRVKGRLLQSREGRDYFAFYKVPFAKAPLGKLRFKSPEVVEAWEGTRDEGEVAPQCIQRAKYAPTVQAVGEEDCLYMNIYTPKLPNADGQEEVLMPTLFYIHGGGFTDGNGSRYGAKYFMDEDVVLITFQFRLGPFGFLSTEDGEISGNMGFKDQVMGLRWVRDNVKYFGGDPNRVMIFGNSAGGFAVSHLMISPMAKGLFQRAITQSGGSYCGPVLDSDDAKKTLKSLAVEVGCNSTSQRELIRCLRNTDAHDLAVARTGNITYNLIIEEYETEDSADVFMPDTPYKMVESGRVNKVPWIIGVNSAESVGSALTLLKDTELIETLNKNFSATANKLMSLNLDDFAEASLQKVKDFYFGDELIGNDTVGNLTNLDSDRFMVHCSKVQALMQAEYSDVYLYYLSKEAAKSYADKMKLGFPPGEYGANHADELQFLFNYYGYPEYPVDSPYFTFSRLLVKIWVQFAATGKPYSPSGIDWETAKPGESPISWFELNEHPRPTTVLQSRMEFWDQFSHEDLNFT